MIAKITSVHLIIKITLNSIFKYRSQKWVKHVDPPPHPPTQPHTHTHTQTMSLHIALIHGSNVLVFQNEWTSCLSERNPYFSVYRRRPVSQKCKQRHCVICTRLFNYLYMYLYNGIITSSLSVWIFWEQFKLNKVNYF